jgi:hypothetical protein
MNLPKMILTLFVVILGAMVSGSVLARGHGGHGGHSGGGRSGAHSGGHHSGSGHRFRGSGAAFGFIAVSPAIGYYSPPYYYPPYYDQWPAMAPASPPVYIEQGQAEPAPAPEEAQAYWYYCPNAKSYYPYVKQCPEGWQRTVPQPVPQG